jgi:hypothetical protein
LLFFVFDLLLVFLLPECAIAFVSDFADALDGVAGVAGEALVVSPFAGEAGVAGVAGVAFMASPFDESAACTANPMLAAKTATVTLAKILLMSGFLQ